MSIILDLGADWYFFLIFAGGILIIAAIVLFFESRNVSEQILHIKPLVILKNILLNQIGFYMFYLLVVFTLDILGFEIFWWTQVFTAVEFDFITKRGLLTGLSLIITMAATSIITTSTVQTYRNMLDYCFTVFVLHFIVVSIVAGDFPVYGAWWVASAVGLTLFMIFSERLSYHLETMSYQSSLHEPKYKSRKSKKEETSLPAIDDQEIDHFSSSGYSSRKLSATEDEEKFTSKSDGEESSPPEQAEESKISSKEGNRSSDTEDSNVNNMESDDKIDSDKEKKNSLRKEKPWRKNVYKNQMPEKVSQVNKKLDVKEDQIHQRVKKRYQDM